jgi:hypothetical protein
MEFSFAMPTMFRVARHEGAIVMTKARQREVKACIRLLRWEIGALENLAERARGEAMTDQREVKSWLDQHDRHVMDWLDFWMSRVPKPPDERTRWWLREVLAFEEVRLH